MSYNKGKIYKIISNNTDKIYIGSTCCNLLSSRFSGHNCNYKKYKLGEMSYITSFDILDCGNCQIILLEDYPCESKDQLRAREQYYIDLYKDICVNKQCAFLSLEKKKQNKHEYNKKYIEQNKEELSQKNKIWRENNQEKCKKLDKLKRERNPEKYKLMQKKYREDNKEYFKNKNAKYIEEHKDSLNEYHKKYRESKQEMITCKCGALIKLKNTWHHEHTQKHINFIKNNIQ